MSRKNKVLVFGLFIYTILIVYLMFFAFDRVDNSEYLSQLGELGVGWNISRIPFGISNLDIFSLGNILCFAPYGFILARLKKMNFIVFIVSFVAIIFGVELIQKVTHLGVFDVEDVLANSIGATIGYATTKIYKLFKFNKITAKAIGIFVIGFLLTFLTIIICEAINVNYFDMV